MVNHDIVDRAGSGGGRRRLMTAIHGSQCFLRRLLFLLVWLRFYNSFRSFLFLPPSLWSTFQEKPAAEFDSKLYLVSSK